MNETRKPMQLFSRFDFLSVFNRYAERRLAFPIISVLIILAGGLAGIIIGFALDLKYLGKEVGRLNTPGRPNTVITVYADDGTNKLGEYAVFLHSPLKYEQIPDLTKKAIMATEEPHFLEHDGLDPLRMVESAIRTLMLTSDDDGPTLAQAVSKILLSRNLSSKGKIQNWLLGIEIERLYSKDRIMWMYANHCPLGEIVYGVEAGAETYFAKPAGILTLEESALLAGMPNAPNVYSPTKDLQAAQNRRNQILNSMARYGYVTQKEADQAKATPVLSSAISPHLPHYSEFNYPLEEIRRYVEDKYSGYGDLKVYSTINIDAQRKATEEVRKELRLVDQTKKLWRSVYINIGADSSLGVPTQEQLQLYQHPDWYRDIYQQDPYQRDTYVTGLITRVDAAANEVSVRFGSYTSRVTANEMGWSGRQPGTEFKVGDLAEFHIKDVSMANKHLTVELSQIPAARAAEVTLHAGTGEIITMVGGYDFYHQPSNDATQAARQTGSCFTPFIYTAAVEWGMTPDTKVDGKPISIGDWQPRNYDGSLGSGELPMKTTLAKQLNVPAVHLLETVSIQTGAQMVARFGIKVPMAPYLPSALGATEVPLDQMVSAYSAFANRGIRVEPHLIRRIESVEGKLIEEWEETTHRVVNPYVALTMVDMMRGAVDEIKAKGNLVLPPFLAGARGMELNGNTDWFIGYTPTYVTGVWIGSPDGKEPIGPYIVESRALRVFSTLMEEFLRDKPTAKAEQFLKPPPMPEDMKELFRERQRELAAERAQFEEDAAQQTGDGSSTLPASNSNPKLEQMTLPPPTSEQTRPRESDPSKRKGKKG
jgi:penicillin-binding protein 1A